MQNDKAFIAYALVLFFGISTVVGLVVGLGADSFPTPAYLMEHVTLGVLMRGYYKSFDGVGGLYALGNWVRDYFGITELQLPASAATATH